MELHSCSLKGPDSGEYSSALRDAVKTVVGQFESTDPGWPRYRQRYKLLATPSAIAGVTRRVLGMRTKL